jgi:hypothetical protein
VIINMRGSAAVCGEAAPNIGNTGSGLIRATRVIDSAWPEQRTLKNNKRQEINISHPAELFVHILRYKREDGIF